jgi:cytidylate kinase
MIIAIDGPAGAGKSTVARTIAHKLGFLYIDTGAMYRALTLKALDERIGERDILRLVEMANNTTIELMNKPDGFLQVLLDGRDVTDIIRQTHITKLVSEIAKVKEVRQVMLELQRRLGLSRDSVLDGRDIGTVVFPDADKKFFIDAQFPERVKRRYNELKELDHHVSLEAIELDLRNRDTIDSKREVAPLKKAEDAIYIDTTNMTIEEVVNKVLNEIKSIPPDRFKKYG